MSSDSYLNSCYCTNYIYMVMYVSKLNIKSWSFWLHLWGYLSILKDAVMNGTAETTDPPTPMITLSALLILIQLGVITWTLSDIKSILKNILEKMNKPPQWHQPVLLTSHKKEKSPRDPLIVRGFFILIFFQIPSAFKCNNPPRFTSLYLLVDS